MKIPWFIFQKSCDFIFYFSLCFYIIISIYLGCLLFLACSVNGTFMLPVDKHKSCQLVSYSMPQHCLFIHLQVFNFGVCFGSFHIASC